MQPEFGIHPTRSLAREGFAAAGSTNLSEHMPSRVLITSVEPQVDDGRYAVKRVQGEPLHVKAAIVTDGHDLLRAELLWRRLESQKKPGAWQRQPLENKGNDEYGTTLSFDRLGRYEFTVAASLDRFATWARNLYRKLKAGDTQVKADFRAGVLMLAAWQRSLPRDTQKTLQKTVTKLEQLATLSRPTPEAFLSWLRNTAVKKTAALVPDPQSEIIWPRPRLIEIERPRAGHSAWYEFFPRSTAGDTSRSGTFKDCHRYISYAADMGFDMIYLPPIHPIGKTARKGKNNSVTADPSDVGSPWAIGNEDGGFYDINPELGTLKDFTDLVNFTRGYHCEIAIDLAFQCSPDHPYVKSHPEWFMRRPDGSIAYAENPPKKYQDIFPFDFENDHWQALWQELRDVVKYWVDCGIKAFRVDNPHTKPFSFWEWLIADIRRTDPDVIFLAEAFSRPYVMEQLAKIGFSQSYTYFTWRESKAELTKYLEELNNKPQVDFFRPNFWPNTPDILPRHLQNLGARAHKKRLVLAATLASNYGIYGPVFEQCVSQPLQEGKEDYLDSEKYEVKHWELDIETSLAPFIQRVNQIRRVNPALHHNRNMRFVDVPNDQLIAYLKRDGKNCILVVVNLDETHRQQGMVDVPIHELGIVPDSCYAVHDLLNDARYYWQGWKNYVELRPDITPAHIFRLELPEPVTSERLSWDDDSLPFRGE